LSSCLLSINVNIKVCRTVILPIVLYGCKIWSLSLKENTLNVSENRVLERIFGHKGTEVTGGWRKIA
jgi:hypothetical protein